MIETRVVTLFQKSMRTQATWLHSDTPCDQWAQEVWDRIKRESPNLYLPLTKKLINWFGRRVFLNVAILNKKGYWYAKKRPVKMRMYTDRMLREMINKEVKRYVEGTVAPKI